MLALGSRVNTSVKRAAPAAAFRRNVRSHAGEGKSPLNTGLDEAIPDGVKESLKPKVEDTRATLKEGTTDFQEIMNFDGVAPELVNGRLAMLGFTAALAAELFSHVDIFTQFKNYAGPVFIAAAVILIASIVPIVRGTDNLDDGAGGEGVGGLRPGFNITNELINGRAAMFGLALLLVYEAGARGPMF